MRFFFLTVYNTLLLFNHTQYSMANDSTSQQMAVLWVPLLILEPY